MAISAFDTSGRLKKHALLGTSLASDPSRASERESYQSLYGEAQASAGAGRAGMLGRLEPRFRSFASAQQGRLEDIATQKAAFESEAGELRDPELELEQQRKVQEYTDWNKAMAHTKRPRIPLKYRRSAKDAYRALSRGDRTAWQQEKRAKGESGSMRQWERDYFAQEVGSAEDQQRQYEANLNAEIDRINAAYIPLQEEELGREQRLMDRIDLYNMFLGE